MVHLPWIKPAAGGLGGFAPAGEEGHVFCVDFGEGLGGHVLAEAASEESRRAGQGKEQER